MKYLLLILLLLTSCITIVPPDQPGGTSNRIHNHGKYGNSQL